MSVRRIVGVLPWLIMVAVPVLRASAPPTITADQAREHAGKRVTVCGEIVAVGRALSKRQGGKQVFLHFDKAPPGSPFVAIVIGLDLENYWHLDKAVHRKACATGYIKIRDDLVYTVIDAINQMTFTGDAPP
jgi:hypothetical protein